MPDRANDYGRRVPVHQPGHHEANTAFLRAEIRETRARMSDSLDALGERLNPNRLKAQVKDNIRNATVGRVEHMARNAADRVQDTGHGVLGRIRENPIPAAMVGIGLGWLLFRGRHRDDRTLWERSYTGESTTGYIGDVSAATPRLMQDDAGGGMGSTIAEESGVVDRVRERVTDIGETVKDTAGNVGYAAKHRAGDVAERIDHAFDENPIGLGMAALAVGMAAGLAIPESHREREMIGPMRDQLAGRVRERFDDTRDRVQHAAQRVVEETKDVAREAARDEGLTS